jgi:pimeloyl-ACP methyl ester carboxylesterase
MSLILAWNLGLERVAIHPNSAGTWRPSNENETKVRDFPPGVTGHSGARVKRASPKIHMGHSRGGHICFRVAQRRPDLFRKLILAEPGGELDATLDPAFKPGPSPLAARIAASAEKIAAGDIDGGLTVFMDALEGPGSWQRLPATSKQLLRDNATTLIGQTRDKRPPFSKADAAAITTPTLFIGGAKTKGALPQVLHTLAANVAGSRTEMIPGTTHPMFEQAPQRFCEIVLEFLAG